jgi:rhamnogalacturonan endolyase
MTIPRSRARQRYRKLLTLLVLWGCSEAGTQAGSPHGDAQGAAEAESVDGSATLREAGTNPAGSMGGVGTMGGAASIGDAAMMDDAGTMASAGGGTTPTDLAACRGVVAVQSMGGIYVGWRSKATDPPELAFNVYRGTTRVNTSPIAGATNLLDPDGSAGASYTVRPVVGGAEQAASEAFSALSTNYVRIPIDSAGSTQAGRLVGVGDLDGDCRYDFVVKRANTDPDVTQADADPNETIKLEAYNGDGRFMWRRDLGRNIRPGVWYSPFVVYDLDGDGKAEIALKASEVETTLGGDGDLNHDGDTDYREADGHVSWNLHADAEFLEIWSGETGKTAARAPWIPVGPWGSDGNRYNRNQMAIAYLDGSRPSVLITRGGNSRNEVHAYDFRVGKLTRRWAWVAANGGGNYGHNVRAGDLDGDGRDEFLFFNVAIDDDGSRVLWNTMEQHGDRFHLSDIDPDRPGMEIFYIQEFADSYMHPVSLRDARTGALIWGPTGDWGDVGRGLSANIDARHRGMESWASAGSLFDAKGTDRGARPNTPNMAIWWDADRERELIDTTAITKWNGTGLSNQMSAGGCAAGTRNIPMGYADVLGDWREEAWWLCNNNTELRIYVSTALTTFRMYTFMQDPEYRTGVATMTSGYVQSPHTSFYVGSDMSPAPPPRLAIRPGS